MSHVVLVVDDDESNRVTMQRILAREGYEVKQADSGRAALEIARSVGVDLVLTDLKMPGMSGIELLKAVRTLDSDIQVMVMTAYGSVETAVEAMKEGAHDFVTKPLRRVELLNGVQRALERRSLTIENRQLRMLVGDGNNGDIAAKSPAMHQLISEVEQVGPSDASVLLTGESGTGKGRVARMLHRLSARRDRRFITVNCASLPDQLLESELFGYERGAFTGATRRKEGRFDLAKGGTIFLDEISEMQPATQVKLLRVLQEGEYERVGGTDTLKADARVIAATNRNIEEELASGRFRTDLFYRLNVIHLNLPPLRDRYEDILLLAVQFLEHFAQKNKKGIRGFSAEAAELLNAWSWPGNVRELENVVERAVVLCRDDFIGVELLPPKLCARGPARSLQFAVGTPLKHVERRLIEETLRSVDGDKTLAANLLGITARTIYRREAEWEE